MQKEEKSDDKSDRFESVGKYTRTEAFILTLIRKTREMKMKSRTIFILHALYIRGEINESYVNKMSQKTNLLNLITRNSFYNSLK